MTLDGKVEVGIADESMVDHTRRECSSKIILTPEKMHFY
jgi:hypothetical protein